MLKRTVLAAAIVTAMSNAALAADPIVGNWRTQSGETAAIAPCGGESFCVTLKTGNCSPPL